METRKIILVDDKPVYRDAIRTLLGKIAEIEIVAEASNGKEFIELVRADIPCDLVLMDIEMPEMNGIEATQKALKINPALIIIGLSMYDDENYIADLIKAGAKGFLLKLSDNTNILKAILTYPGAEVFFSKEITFDIEKQNVIKNANNKTILVADNQINTRIIIEKALQEAGYNVVLMSNGLEALNYLKQQPTDLIVTDSNLPEINGIRLAKDLRLLPKYENTPILLIASESEIGNKQMLREAGITGWIQKPLQIEKFLMYVKRAIR